MVIINLDFCVYRSVSGKQMQIAERTCDSFMLRCLHNPPRNLPNNPPRNSGQKTQSRERATLPQTGNDHVPLQVI